MSIIGGIAEQATKYSTLAGQLTGDVSGNGFNISGVGTVSANNLAGVLTTPIQDRITGLGIQTRALNMGGNNIIGAGVIASGISPLSADLNFNNYNLTNANQITGASIFGAIQTQNQPGIRSIGSQVDNLSLGGNRVIGVGNPINATDAATKEYVDGIGLAVNASNLVGTTLATSVVNSSLQNLGVQNEPLDMGSNNINAVGSLGCGALKMSGHTISNTNANGNVALSPSGTGEVDIFKNLHMNTNIIRGLGAPTNANDATTKTYVDSAIPTAGTLTGNTLSAFVVNSSLQTLGPQAQNLDMNTKKIINLATPTLGGDATTKTYVDGVVSFSIPTAETLSGQTLNDNIIKSNLKTLGAQSEPLDMNSLKIINLGTPTLTTDATTKTYVDTAISGIAIPTAATLSGTTLNASIVNSSIRTLGQQANAINMTSNKIINLGTPTLAADATTKSYVDTAISNIAIPTAATLSGTTLNVNIVTSSIQRLGLQAQILNMNYNRISQLAEPVSPTDAATKYYIDNKPISQFSGTSLNSTVVSSNIQQLGSQTQPLDMNSHGVANANYLTVTTVGGYITTPLATVGNLRLEGNTISSPLNLNLIGTNDVSITSRFLYIGQTNFPTYVILDGTTDNSRSLLFKQMGITRVELGVNVINGTNQYFFIYDSIIGSDYIRIDLSTPTDGMRLPRLSVDGFVKTKNTNGTLFISSSDRRIKTDEVLLDPIESLQTVLKLQPKSFVYNAAYGGTRSIGFIAQDVETIIPEAVDGKKFEYEFVREKGGPGYDGDIVKDENGDPVLDYTRPRYRAFDTTPVLSVLVSAFQELERRNRLLEQKVVELEEIVSEFISEFSPNKRAKLE